MWTNLDYILLVRLDGRRHLLEVDVDGLVDGDGVVSLVVAVRETPQTVVSIDRFTRGTEGGSLSREGSLSSGRDLLENVLVSSGSDPQLDHGVPVVLAEEVLVHEVDDAINSLLF